jgi:thiol-disulfide isomerase/thioredoxin
MTKKFIYFLLCAFVFASCGDSSDTDTETIEEQYPDNFTISGKIDGAANQKMYLEAQSQNGVISIASGVIAQDGSFEIKGNIAGFGLYQLRLGEIPTNMILLTLVPNDHLKIKATSETFAKTPQASNTSWSKNMTEYMVLLTDFRQKQAEISANVGKYSEEELMKKYTELQVDVEKFALERMKADPANPFNLVLSTFAVPSADFESWNRDNLEILRTVAEAMQEKFKGSPMADMLSRQVYDIEVAYDQYVANTSGTRPAPEIALNNPMGKEIRLSSLRGNYVLIDFWASWCAPCRQESPTVVKMYKKYKDRGFTVYSVSLDNDRAKWMEAIEKDGLIWPNHVSDLLQWKSPMPQLYGFSGIPHTVLLNPEGNIIGTGLRGASLEQKLKEIFEK